MEGLKDKVFIVTGGGSGIGAATVRRLLAEGARVAAAGSSPDKLSRIREQAVEAADRLLTVQFDLRDEASIASLVTRTTERFGRLDGVANVAGAVSGDLMARDQGVDTMDPQVWAEMMRINVTGTGLVIRESLPALAAAGGGSIVNVSSLAAWQREEWLTAYASSKIALHALTRHTAHVWGKKNIRVNAVAPGVVLTENVRTGTPPEIRQALLEKTALPRLGEPEDLANMIVFLLSGESSWITGQILSVDGGVTMRE
ncbi:MULTISPECIES: SDR family NAD(P)-dependent oxidoreductase [unclassified Streptomyces]|uniref:SDR family NAD(P)-dependent oxidoreductase n=1 Tax=unclassified Streptomyces TaxID=2593676 RepID=UPI003648AC10